MSEPTNPVAVRPRAATRDEHATRVLTLAQVIARAIDADNEDTTVVLDALINVYLQAAHVANRDVPAAEALIQAGGQVLLSRAEAKRALAADPFDAPPTVH